MFFANQGVLVKRIRHSALRGSGFGFRGIALNRFLEGLHGFGQRLPLVGRVEIEINPAQRPGAVALAENDRDLFVESNAMAQFRVASLVGPDGLAQQGLQCGLEFIRGLIKAHDVFLVSLHGFRNLAAKLFSGHDSSLRGTAPEVKSKSKPAHAIRWSVCYRRLSFGN